MKKILVILLILVFFGFIAFWIFVGFGSKSAPINSNAGGVTLPSAGSVPITTIDNSIQKQSTITIIGSGGTAISTNDFLHVATTGAYPSAGYYYLGYHTASEGVVDPTATDNPPYLIEYIAGTQYFGIELLQEPIGETRLSAEQFLMTDLGISESEMCQLNYMVSVPDSVNSQYASKNLGFSFCPGATVLPQ